MQIRSLVIRYKTFSAVVAIATLGIILLLAGPKTAANIIFGVTSVFVLLPIVVDMVRSILKKEYGLDILAVTAITASLALGEFLAAIVIVLMLTGGEALEDYAQERAKKESYRNKKRSFYERSGKVINIT